MDCSMPGLPVHHRLPEFTQTHVHWVSDAKCIPFNGSYVVYRYQSFFIHSSVDGHLGCFLVLAIINSDMKKKKNKQWYDEHLGRCTLSVLISLYWFFYISFSRPSNPSTWFLSCYLFHNEVHTCHMDDPDGQSNIMQWNVLYRDTVKMLRVRKERQVENLRVYCACGLLGKLV